MHWLPPTPQAELEVPEEQVPPTPITEQQPEQVVESHRHPPELHLVPVGQATPAAAHTQAPEALQLSDWDTRQFAHAAPLSPQAPDVGAVQVLF